LKPSSKLQAAIHNIVGSFQKTSSAIDEAFKIGREEGFNEMEIGNMVRKEMLATGYDSRTVRRALPPSAKHIQKTRRDYFDEDKMSSSEHENIANPVIAQAIQETEIVSQESQVRASPIEASSSNAKKCSDGWHMSPSIGKDISRMSAGFETGILQEKWNISPEEYQLEYLEEYNKDLLIRIIKHLRTENVELNRRISNLEEYYKRKQSTDE
jgi:hypothetical protein